MLGDLDLDGDIDSGDYLIFSGCMAGPNVTTPPPGCDPVDFDRADGDCDSDVDLGDFTVFMRNFDS